MKNMKKELILTERNASYNELSRFFKEVAVWFQTPMEWLRKYYSAVLEREVSSKQASYMTQAQLAFILFLLFLQYYCREFALLGLLSAFTSVRKDKKELYTLQNRHS